MHINNSNFCIYIAKASIHLIFLLQCCPRYFKAEPEEVLQFQNQDLDSRTGHSSTSLYPTY